MLISKNSTNSDWVNKELDIAMNQEIENKIIKVLPALLDDSDLPGFLKGKVYLDFRKKMISPINVKKSLIESPKIYQVGSAQSDILSPQVEQVAKNILDKSKKDK